MLYASKNVSTRTLLKLSAAVLLPLVGLSPAHAANTGAPPQLIPYTMSSLAGNTQVTADGGTATATAPAIAGGYGGDGGPGSGASLNAPLVLAVDSVGNVYFADLSNGLIREVNAQTGVINTVAGKAPSNCTGTSCHVNTGCADGVLAAGSPIGGNVEGIAVDAYGNVYFADAISETVSVVYRGGTQAAKFIALENPNAAASGVQVGYVYHIAGSINLSTCAGTGSKAASSSAAAIPAGDGNLAFNGGGTSVTATFGTVGPLGLDSAGNLYIGDGSPNNVVRVINTQPANTQTFFGVSVQPGYIASIVDCGNLTQLCPPGAGNSPETLTNTGVGGPAGAGVFNTLAVGEGAWMSSDAYGNIFQLNYKGATPGIYLSAAYAGGTALGKMIVQANIGFASAISNTATLTTATPGDFYYLLQSITLRPSSIATDPFGNLYYLDNHYGQIYRVDVNAVPYPTGDGLEISYLTSAGLTSDSNRSYIASNASPGFCYPPGGQSTTNPTVADYMTSDQFGNGCPAIQANGIGAPHSGTGYGTTIADGPGNLYIADRTNNQIRKISLNTIFPSYPVGQQLNPTNLVGEQSLQFHFDPGNLPVKTTPLPAVTTTAFSMAPGIPDFTINPMETQFTTGTTAGITIGPTTYTTALPATLPELPLCYNTTGSVDLSLDCVINVIFSPTAPGLRQGQVVVTTANGSVYNYGLTGIGVGPQLAIDGGAQAPINIAGLGNPGQVTVTSANVVYTADPANNRIVIQPTDGAGNAVGSPSTIGPSLPQLTAGVKPTTLSGPMGVAVDASGNVFIADTGNNRIIEVSQITGAQTVIGQILAASGPSGQFGPAYTQYSFNGPEGLAVDRYGNVYVADTGNGKVVEIPSNPVLGGATPLLQYPGAPTFTSPVALALDTSGNLYVADPGNIQIVKIPAGGGDLQTLPGATLPGFGAILTAPTGVAVDAAGNIYVSDAGTNQVYELPSASGLSATTLPINFTGLNLTGASGKTTYQGGSLALDPKGNLYLSDPANSRVLFDNRYNPVVPCGVVAQDQPAVTCGGAPLNPGPNTLTVTNIGNAIQTITPPFAQVTSTSPTSTTAFSENTTGSTDCSQVQSLLPGAYCTLSFSFQPTSDGAQAEIVTINGNSTQTVTLQGNGEQPLVQIMLAETAPSGGAVAGKAATVTATVTQPNTPPGGTPTGTVTFSYSESCAADAATGSMTVPLTPSSTPGAATASFTLPVLLEGRQYTVNATYNSDALDSVTVATPLIFYIPGIAVTATATPISYVYGQAVPAITGTVTGINAADNVTYKLVTAATSSTAIGVYPITVAFSGANACNYGLPTVYVPSTTTPATVTEKAAPLGVKANNATTQYGAPNVTYVPVLTGLVNGDRLAETFTPVQSSILNVGTYPIVTTVIGKAAGNYAVTVTNGTLTVTSAPTTVSVAPTAPSVLPTALATDPITITVGTAIPGGKGTPTGTITITDVFTPITPYSPGGGAQQTAGGEGLGTSLAPVTLGPYPLTAGVYNYTPTNMAVGSHAYTVSYSGDSNFQTTSTAAATNVIVDTADFTVTAPNSPILISPGTLPGGNSSVAGEAAATPQQAVVTVTSILSYTGTVYFSCIPQSPSYTTCALVAPAVSVPKPSTGTTNTITSTLSIQTPATLPLGFNFNVAELREPVTMSKTVLAFLPLGVLAFCVRRKRSLGKALWMVVGIAFAIAGLNGCGGNSVHFFTPVPSGPQTLTVYACTVQSSCPTISITGAITSGNASVTAVSNTAGLAVGGSLIGPSIGFTGTTTSGSTTVSGIPSTIGLASGVAVTGAGIAPGTTISAVTAATATANGSVTLSTAATASGLDTALTAASPIPAGTTILAVGSGTITLSAPATGTGTVGLTASGTSTGLVRSFTFSTSFE